MRPWLSLLSAFLALSIAAPAQAFCGFYVAQANAKLFNSASRVVLARKDEQTVVTMESNYQGSPANFALIVPVPTVIRRDQVRVADAKLLDRIDTYSAPRLVEYHDPDPCAPPAVYDSAAGGQEIVVTSMRAAAPAKTLGVKIEARYQVGEYDILVLSAKQSGGLVTWLTQNGYKMPPGAAPVVGSYLRQNMKFFVAKVNLKRRARQGTETLRPLQISYASRKFMLPIRLGTVNANGPQDLFVFALTTKGRVETTNYRTVKLASNMNIPIYVKAQFPAFYRAAFTQSVAKERMRSVFLEYAWDSGSCDPCASQPLDEKEAKGLGASWADNDSVFVTRLHLRYTRATFPEDLMLQETGDDESFQTRFVLRHPFAGAVDCQQGQDYRNSLVERWDDEASNLASLTGWSLPKIKAEMRRNGARPTADAGRPASSGLAGFWQRLGQSIGSLFG